jgi:hypothetical protein
MGNDIKLGLKHYTECSRRNGIVVTCQIFKAKSAFLSEYKVRERGEKERTGDALCGV